MKQICLFASEIAIITRHNRFEEISNIIYKLWNKHFKDDCQHTHKLLGDQNLDITLSETYDECINRISTNNNLDLRLHIDECLNSNDINNLIESQNKILSECENLNINDLKQMKKSVMKKTNTNFGTKYESNSLNLYTKQTGNNVLTIENFFKKKIGNLNNIDWYIGGKIDGITDDKVLIEVKNRTKKLFYSIRDYEKVQIMSYLKILNLNSAHLVESLKMNRQEMNIIDVKFDKQFWKKEILSKILLFIDFFDKFMNNIELKVMLLTEPEKIDVTYSKLLF